MNYDVVIIGGGPAGSTCGAMLKKYQPALSVAIFEREKFPRDHVGESQLPIIGSILDEIGVWDKVEAAGFPIKIGGTYRWGNTNDLWDFHFLPKGQFMEESRPARFAGQRRETAFQVDRGIYDQILLEHASDLGCLVFENTPVRKVKVDQDSVTGIVLNDGQVIVGRHYVDATGHPGTLRRAVGVGIEEPSTLRNVAAWDYWQDAEWAVTIGQGGTRIQVMSLGYGWLWFIPISTTRTSVGFVCPAEYYKSCGRSMEELYLHATQSEPRIASLLQSAQRERKFQTTKDWSFIAETMAGRNWILVGESAGFADPILSAGLSLTHMSAKEAAFTILELDRGGDAKWLKQAYTATNRRKLLQHIKFADYWYRANSHFKDLKEYTREIALDAGLELDAEQAFQWLGTGGFIEEDMQAAGLGTVSIARLHQVTNRLSEKPATSVLDGYNGFALSLSGAESVDSPSYRDGRVYRSPTLVRGTMRLPLNGTFGLIVDALKVNQRAEDAFKIIVRGLRSQGRSYTADTHSEIVQCLEAMVRGGWVQPLHLIHGDPLRVNFLLSPEFIDRNRDEQLSASMRASALRS